jgi:hypothetical protein
MDNRERPSWGVGIFVEPVEDGKLRVIIDDLQRIERENPLPRWEMWAFVTNRDCESTDVLEHRLPREDYEALGRTVMARLGALLKVHGGA